MGSFSRTAEAAALLHVLSLELDGGNHRTPAFAARFGTAPVSLGEACLFMTDTAPTIPTLDSRGLSKNRIEALADGIFAVAMTLLVLDIKSPVNLAFRNQRRT